MIAHLPPVSLSRTGVFDFFHRRLERRLTLVQPLDRRLGRSDQAK